MLPHKPIAADALRAWLTCVATATLVCIALLLSAGSDNVDHHLDDRFGIAHDHSHRAPLSASDDDDALDVDDIDPVVPAQLSTGASPSCVVVEPLVVLEPRITHAWSVRPPSERRSEQATPLASRPPPLSPRLTFGWRG